jgi:hypothetical protein
MSENQRKKEIVVTDYVLNKINITRIPITYPDPVNVTTHPVNSEKAHSRNPYQ